MQTWSVTIWLIVINVAVFVLGAIGFGFLEQAGVFSAAALFAGEFWRLITFQFLHANIQHLFFNMLALYMFGPLVEQYLGARRYLAFYLLCGMAGAGMYLVLLMLGLLHDGIQTPLVGASAGIFGVLVAASRIAPDTTVMLLFPPIPMKLKTLAWVFIGWAAFTILRHGGNAGGEAAHLGGAALGFALISNPQWLNFAGFNSRGRRGSGW